MSRPFMFGMLVLLGVLLYLSSYALTKHTEPPPPPTAEERLAQKEAEEKEATQRKESEKQRYQQMAEQKKKLEAGKVDTKTVKAAPSNANSMLPDPATRSDQSIDIRYNWFADRKDGAAGIEQERALREKNNKKTQTPKPQPLSPVSGGGGMPMMPPAGAAGGGHQHAPGDTSHKH